MEVLERIEEISGPRRRKSTAKTVLVVEDETFVREVTCDVLEGAGYRVLQAGTVAEARDVIFRCGRHIDLLLCDVVLPDGSGVALAQALEKQLPDLETVVASGYPSAVLSSEFNLPAGRAVLRKPYCASSLITEVQRVLRRDRGR